MVLLFQKRQSLSQQPFLKNFLKRGSDQDLNVIIKLNSAKMVE